MIVLCNRLYIATGRLFLDVCRLEDCQPGKKTAREAPHGAHTESEAEEAGGNVAESTEKGLL